MSRRYKTDKYKLVLRAFLKKAESGEINLNENELNKRTRNRNSK